MTGLLPRLHMRPGFKTFMYDKVYKLHNIFDDQNDKSRTHCLRLYSGWFQFRYDNGRAKSEMP